MVLATKKVWRHIFVKENESQAGYFRKRRMKYKLSEYKNLERKFYFMKSRWLKLD